MRWRHAARKAGRRARGTRVTVLTRVRHSPGRRAYSPWAPEVGAARRICAPRQRPLGCQLRIQHCWQPSRHGVAGVLDDDGADRARGACARRQAGRSKQQQHGGDGGRARPACGSREPQQAGGRHAGQACVSAARGGAPAGATTHQHYQDDDPVGAAPGDAPTCGVSYRGDAPLPLTARSMTACRPEPAGMRMHTSCIQGTQYAAHAGAPTSGGRGQGKSVATVSQP